MKIFFHFVVSFDNDQSYLHLCEAAIHKQFLSRDVAGFAALRDARTAALPNCPMR
jgi:hypothetical protein